MHEKELKGQLEGCVNWMAVVEELIGSTSCNPEDEKEFEEILLCAQLQRKSAEDLLEKLKG